MTDFPTDISSICDELINFETEHFNKKIDDKSENEQVSKKAKLIQEDLEKLSENSKTVLPPIVKDENPNISIKDAKLFGKFFLRSVTEKCNCCLVFLSLGTSGQSEIVSHLGAFTPETNSLGGSRFFNEVNKVGSSETLNFKTAVISLMSYLLKMKKKNSNLFIVMSSKQQMDYFTGLVVDAIGSEFNDIVDGLFDVLFFTKESSYFKEYDAEDLATLQVSPGNKENLLNLLYSKSDLMSLSIFETFCIMLYQEESVRKKFQEMIVLATPLEKEISQQSGEDNKIETNKIEKAKNNNEDKMDDDSIKCKDFLLMEEEASTIESSNLDEITENNKDDESMANPNKFMKDFFNSVTSSTIFINPIFFTPDTAKYAGSGSGSVKEHALVFLEAFVYPEAKSFQVAVRPNTLTLKSKNFRKMFSCITKGKDVSLVTSSGQILPCHLRFQAFGLLSEFLGKIRRENKEKQFNIFVKDFNILKTLMHYNEFAYLIKSCENMLTLFNQNTSSLVRVPDMPLPMMVNYISSILSSDDSSVLHKEHISNVFSGRK